MTWQFYVIILNVVIYICSMNKDKRLHHEYNKKILTEKYNETSATIDKNSIKFMACLKKRTDSIQMKDAVR